MSAACCCVVVFCGVTGTLGGHAAVVFAWVLFFLISPRRRVAKAEAGSARHAFAFPPPQHSSGVRGYTRATSRGVSISDAPITSRIDEHRLDTGEEREWIHRAGALQPRTLSHNHHHEQHQTTRRRGECWLCSYWVYSPPSQGTPCNKGKDKL